MAGLEEMSVATFNAFLGKSEGRDKLARFIQYMARAFIGFAGLKGLKKGTKLYKLSEHATNIMKQLAGARRTHRWCKEFPIIQSIFQTFPRQICMPVDWGAFADRALELLQKTTLATFLVIDHVGWLKSVKVLSGGKRAGTGTIQLGLKFFCASNFVGALVQVKKFRKASAKANEGDGKPGEKSKCLQNAFKHALLVLQTAHLSRLHESHDALVGVAGMISSAMDVLAQWPEKRLPEKKALAKISPDAKAMAKSCDQVKPKGS